MININELFKRAGGSAHIAAKLDLHQHSVNRWRKNGVPVYYWEYLGKLAGLSIEDMYAITAQILKRKNADK